MACLHCRSLSPYSPYWTRCKSLERWGTDEEVDQQQQTNGDINNVAASAEVSPSSVELQSPPPRRTFAADFPGADEVAFVPRQDDGRLRLGLPEEEAELRGAVEAAAVGHGEDQDAHVALQSGQVLHV